VYNADACVRVNSCSSNQNLENTKYRSERLSSSRPLTWILPFSKLSVLQVISIVCTIDEEISREMDDLFGNGTRCSWKVTDVSRSGSVYGKWSWLVEWLKLDASEHQNPKDWFMIFSTGGEQKDRINLRISKTRPWLKIRLTTVLRLVEIIHWLLIPSVRD
jgi:hypothetical protein